MIFVYQYLSSLHLIIIDWIYYLVGLVSCLQESLGYSFFFFFFLFLFLVALGLCFFFK